MTSKEALEKLEKLLKYLPYAVNYKLYHDTIVKDLERLEELEKENEIIKNENCDYQIKNAELQNAIDILKDELEISFEDTTQEGNGYWVVLKNWGGEEEVFIHFNTPNNYELLKEVLDND